MAKHPSVGFSHNLHNSSQMLNLPSRWALHTSINRNYSVMSAKLLISSQDKHVRIFNGGLRRSFYSCRIIHVSWIKTYPQPYAYHGLCTGLVFKLCSGCFDFPHFEWSHWGAKGKYKQRGAKEAKHWRGKWQPNWHLHKWGHTHTHRHA